ncbi:MAG: RtcB family protein [Armatimonadetes bacterium]|nr:RtcB family protein [Armatimonadota bacterium]
MKTFESVNVWGDPVDTDAVLQIQNCAADPSVVGAALMADHHVGYSMPIGGVVAYRDKVSPSGVGFDIACGNKAVLTDMPAKEARRKIARIMDDVFAKVSFGVGMKNQERVDHELFDDPAWNDLPFKAWKDKAREQLGTVGSGNHYVDVFLDDGERVWIGVHFGSRGFGHRVASHFIEAGGGSGGMFVDPVTFHDRSSLGTDYLTGMALAGRYAYAGRDWVCARVAKILGAKILEDVHNHHNFAWKERHLGEDLWVVRKGATPAFPGQKGFVGGSMGDMSVILEGVDGHDAVAAFRSTVHGAGRVMSRTQAAGRLRKGKREGGKVTHDMMHKWVKQAGVELRGAGTDESPHCYKRLPDVLGHHASTVRVLHTLKPIGVAMAGDDVVDPYRD